MCGLAAKGLQNIENRWVKHQNIENKWDRRGLIGSPYF
jgi:hypothetical protein